MVVTADLKKNLLQINGIFMCCPNTKQGKSIAGHIAHGLGAPFGMHRLACSVHPKGMEMSTQLVQHKMTAHVTGIA